MSLIPLNIAMDYPVNWDFKRILRDLIQNFYDAIGYEHFAEEFVYTRGENKNGTFNVEMKTYGHPFSYEWLTYIGGSTKTMSPGDFVGMYGEGFKVCMLCIMRMDGLDVTMESQTWKIKPCRYKERIDGKRIGMLGYKLKERVDDGWTRLILYNVPQCWLRDVEEILLEFFYPENPLFGKKLYETDSYSIYERSNVRIPCRNFYSHGFKGVLYCNFLARGGLPFDVILLVRKDMRNKDTRKREVLRRGEVRECFLQVCEMLDSTASYILLEKMEAYWNEQPRTMVDIHTWYYVICQLVRNVSENEQLVAKFKEGHQGLVYIERKSADGIRNRLIEQTKQWYQKKEYERIVNPIFRFLGAKSLVEEYQKEELHLFEKPSEWEYICIEILFDTINLIFPYKLYDIKPEVIIQKDERSYQPLLYAERRYAKNGKDKRRYTLNKIVMSHDDFLKGKFDNALIKFVDILIHAYGTNKNARINVLLTCFGAACIRHREDLQKCREVWDVRTGKCMG